MRAIELAEEAEVAAECSAGPLLPAGKVWIESVAAELRRLAAVEASVDKLREYLATFHPLGMMATVTTDNVCEVVEEELRRTQRAEVSDGRPLRGCL